MKLMRFSESVALKSRGLGVVPEHSKSAPALPDAVDPKIHLYKEYLDSGFIEAHDEKDEEDDAERARRRTEIFETNRSNRKSVRALAAIIMSAYDFTPRQIEQPTFIEAPPPPPPPRRTQTHAEEPPVRPRSPFDPYDILPGRVDRPVSRPSQPRPPPARPSARHPPLPARTKSRLIVPDPTPERAPLPRRRIPPPPPPSVKRVVSRVIAPPPSPPATPEPVYKVPPVLPPPTPTMSQAERLRKMKTEFSYMSHLIRHRGTTMRTLASCGLAPAAGSAQADDEADRWPAPVLRNAAYQPLTNTDMAPVRPVLMGIAPSDLNALPSSRSGSRPASGPNWVAVSSTRCGADPLLARSHGTDRSVSQADRDTRSPSPDESAGAPPSRPVTARPPADYQLALLHADMNKPPSRVPWDTMQRPWTAPAGTVAGAALAASAPAFYSIRDPFEALEPVSVTPGAPVPPRDAPHPSMRPSALARRVAPPWAVFAAGREPTTGEATQSPSGLPMYQRDGSERPRSEPSPSAQRPGGVGTRERARQWQDHWEEERRALARKQRRERSWAERRARSGGGVDGGRAAESALLQERSLLGDTSSWPGRDSSGHDTALETSGTQASLAGSGGDAQLEVDVGDGLLARRRETWSAPHAAADWLPPMAGGSGTQEGSDRPKSAAPLATLLASTADSKRVASAGGRSRRGARVSFADLTVSHDPNLAVRPGTTDSLASRSTYTDEWPPGLIHM